MAETARLHELFRRSRHALEPIPALPVPSAAPLRLPFIAPGQRLQQDLVVQETVPHSST
jgi:hypothetical protein